MFHDGIIQDQLDKVQAQVQGRVAEFLGLKSALVDLKSSPNPDTAAKAAALYTRQGQLEDLLNTNLDKIKKIQTTGLSLSSTMDILSIGNFASAMESQITDVHNLQSGQPISKSTSLLSGSPMKKVALAVGALAVGFMVIKAVRR